ncbi:DUF3006 domain-containing protein [Oceanobacillus piezotolerans]|uniref:DUF3006 domain-containing protein n=1 Tax=Oceanobacillus piezotolerans TaxID=2448030 RepID=A0A498DG62_9BACI|nr:DUF3006 domain-containing protein [Oceanobacillus piezotolerans]RLL46931.1 DUF3006 domain-containing protein [Oceanobacillus piezotolerans]
MKGILDRFEGNLAIILIEETKEEIQIKKENLPEGSDVHSYFQLTKEEGTYSIVRLDKDQTEKEQQKSADLMTKLRAKSSGSKWKK